MEEDAGAGAGTGTRRARPPGHAVRTTQRTVPATPVPATAAYAVQTALVRHSFALYAALRVSAVATDKVCGYVAGLYNEIRDSRYLVGTELTNLTVRPAAEPRSPATPAAGNN